MFRRILFTTCLAAALLGPAAMLHANSYSFQGLGFLPDPYELFPTPSSHAQGISADGSTVVGRSGYEAFRWTKSGGMVALPGFENDAFGVSADGSVIAGSSFVVNDTLNDWTWVAARWTESGGRALLGDLPGGNFQSEALGVSANGSVVVGYGSSAEGTEAFRWTESDGMVSLGVLPGGNSSFASGISADGFVIVGQSSSTEGMEAIRWTESGGMVGLGDLPGGVFSSAARGVSADGSVIVGQSYSASGYEAFLWTESGGMVGLGDLPGGSFSSAASGVSADGSVIVGYGRSASGDEAFIWNAVDDGMQNLRDVLVANGVSGLDGWLLRGAAAISADGRTIVGYGTNPLGQQEAWIATVPEPSTLLMGALGMVALLLWRRRK